MIIGFIGDMGQGKTLSMIAWAVEHYFKGFRIYSNVIIKGIPFTRLTIEDIIKFSNSEDNFDQTIFLLDEAHIFIDSRGSMKTRNQIIGYWVTQTRKRNCHLFYTTQYYHQVDKRLRASTNAFAECQFREVLLNDKKAYFVLNKFNIIKTNKVKIVPIIFNAEPYFKYYDTRQIIMNV